MSRSSTPTNPERLPDARRLEPFAARAGRSEVKDAAAGHADPALDRERPGPARRRLRPRHRHAARPCRRRSPGRRSSPDDTSHDRGDRLMQARPRRSGPGGGASCYVAPSQNVDAGRHATHRACSSSAAMPERRDPAPEPGPDAEPRAGSPRTTGRACFPIAENPRFLNPDGRHPRQHQQQDHRRALSRPCQLRLGRQPARAALARLMQEREVHSRESFIEAQLDTVPTGGAHAPAADRRGPVVHRRGRARRHARTRAASRRCSARGLERRDERAPARTADLCRLGAGAAGPADPRTSSARWPTEFSHIDPVFLERVYRNVDGAARLVRRHAVRRRRDLHRDRADGTRRCALWLDETLRAGRSKAGAGATRTQAHP